MRETAGNDTAGAPQVVLRLDDRDLTDPRNLPAKRAAKIRGPLDRWSIGGSLGIGAHTSINGTFKSRGEVRIGRYCAFGNNVGLISADHDTSKINQQVWLQQEIGARGGMRSKGPITIGHNVWIGDNAVVLGGVTVGHGAVIAAGAVVTRSIPHFGIARGVPARIGGSRFHPQVVAQLLEIAWWDWDLERMRRNRALFELSIGPDEVRDLVGLVVA